jgi:hypothetical protein
MTQDEAERVQARIQAGEKVDPEVMAEALCVLEPNPRNLVLSGMTTGAQMDADHAMCGRLADACEQQPKAA